MIVIRPHLQSLKPVANNPDAVRIEITNALSYLATIYPSCFHTSLKLKIVIVIFFRV